jgi:hypothetical protein
VKAQKYVEKSKGKGRWRPSAGRLGNFCVKTLAKAFRHECHLRVNLRGTALGLGKNNLFLQGNKACGNFSTKKRTKLSELFYGKFERYL